MSTKGKRGETRVVDVSVGDVGTVHAGAREMSRAAELPRALRLGTKAMRESQAFTPQSPGESEAAYRLRLQRSFLLGAYEDICDSLSSHVFSGGIKVEPPDVAVEDASARHTAEAQDELQDAELDEMVQAWLADMDLQGTSLEEMLLSAFDEGTDCGLVHALVDYPEVPEVPTRAEEIAIGARPYVTLIRGDDVIQIDHRRVLGRDRLIRIHIQGVERVVSGYAETFARRIRVYHSGDPNVEDTGSQSARWARWEEYVADDEDRLPESPQKSGFMIPHVDIPIETWYLRRSGFMQGRPAMQRVAEKNAEHWQSASHQRYALDFARFVQIFRKGFKKGDGAVKVGASVVHDASAPDADMRVIETTGAALGAGRQHLEDCKAELQTMALEPYLRLTAVTATEVGVQKDQADNKVSAWAKGAARFVQKILELMMLWETPTGAEPKSPGKVTVEPSQKLVLSPAQLEFLKWLVTEGYLQQETILRYGKELDLLPEWVDVKKEVDATATAPPKLIGLPMPIGQQAVAKDQAVPNEGSTEDPPPIDGASA